MLTALAIWFTLGGTGAFYWLDRRAPLTWNGVLCIASGGVLGPCCWLIIGITALCEAKFWSKPVWPRRRES